VVVVGAGKAGVGMAAAAAAAAGPACRGGLVIVPHASVPAGGAIGEIAVVGGGHPLPDAAGEAATARVLDLVAHADGRTLVLAVLSGGASALLVAPAGALTLADKQMLTARLLAAGADIEELNTVRKHCSRVKGGGLARAARAAAGLWALVLSDVPGDALSTIASGPTVADSTTFADAAAVLARHLPGDAAPEAIRTHLDRGRTGTVPETLGPGDPALARAETVLVGSGRDAIAAAAAAARARGYAARILDVPLVGDAAAVGRALADELRNAPGNRPLAVLARGETTVRVVPGGRGGRCQQLALAAALALAGQPGVVHAAGTDGIDGSTDAAGACVDGGTVARARAAGFDPAHALAATDSHPLLAATGDLVVTGPTGTNVADLVVALRPAC
jgi:glycerate-2-kinase